jgi:hypothetical protein
MCSSLTVILLKKEKRKRKRKRKRIETRKSENLKGSDTK